MKHMKKRVAALLLTLAMVLSLAPMAFAADEFPDMPAEDDPSYAAVKSAVDNEIMTGENGALNLEGTILRSTVAKMVVTAFAAKGEADLSGYPDVTDGAWYAEWMAKANQMGIMSGTSGRMNPGSKVTLAEVAAMLVRALGLSVDKDATVEGVASWAAPYVKALIDANYITAEDAAAAHEPMTRVAFAEVIYKVSGNGNYAKEENAEITEDVNGNIVITANGVSLKDITVTGDIIIADGVDAGSIVLDGVKVQGRVVVRGAGVELTNGSAASATVVAATTGETTVKADTSSEAGDIAVAGTNGQSADKVVIDMAEPKVTVTTATEVAVQNADGGEVTLQAANASLSVESGTVANVTVADGASGVKVDVAADATIDKVTTNTDLAITGEGTVTEKEGSGTVTDAAGNEVAGSDEPVDVPTVEEPAPEVDPYAPTNGTHTHVYTYGTPDENGKPANVSPFDATRHTVSCTVKIDDKGNVDESGSACGAVIYEAHSYDSETNKCICGATKPTDPTVAEDKTGINAEKKECGTEGASAASHTWEVKADDPAAKALTCTQNGVVVEVCKTCGMKRTTTTPKTGHSLTPFKTEAPSCNEDGVTYFQCTNRGCSLNCSNLDDSSTYESTTIPATNKHNWVLDAGNVGAQAATCHAKGTAVYVCTTCTGDGAPATETKETDIVSTAHEWIIADGKATVAESTNGQTHVITCGNGCGATKTEACNNEVTDAAVAATCTTAGSTAATKCSVCEHVVAATEISELGHNYSTGWTANGETGHYHACLNGCGNKENGATAHTWSATTGEGEDKAAAKDAVCTVCGYRHTTGGSGEGGGQTPAQHEHVKATEWSKDANGHWHACTGSGTCPDNNKCDAAGHNWTGGGEDQAGSCSVCTYTCQKDHSSCTTEATKCSCGFINAEA